MIAEPHKPKDKKTKTKLIGAISAAVIAGCSALAASASGGESKPTVQPTPMAEVVPLPYARLSSEVEVVKTRVDGVVKTLDEAFKRVDNQLERINNRLDQLMGGK